MDADHRGATPIICSDIGGVVIDVESDRLLHQLGLLLGRPLDEVQAAVFHPELLLPFELGRIAPRTYYEGLKERLGLPWTYDQFVRAWNGIFRENHDVIAILRRLRQQHRLLALTNTNTLHLAHIKTAIPSMGLFEAWVASCEVGVRKPDPAIYALALERMGVSPAQAIYIDDRPELVEAGRRVGLTAIRFENSRQLEADLRAAGLTF